MTKVHNVINVLNLEQSKVQDLLFEIQISIVVILILKRKRIFPGKKNE